MCAAPLDLARRKPKGVVRDNGGHAVALLWIMRNIYDIAPGDVFWGGDGLPLRALNRGRARYGADMAGYRELFRRILPERVFGSAGTTSTSYRPKVVEHLGNTAHTLGLLAHWRRPRGRACADLRLPGHRRAAHLQLRRITRPHSTIRGRPAQPRGKW